MFKKLSTAANPDTEAGVEKEEGMSKRRHTEATPPVEKRRRKDNDKTEDEGCNPESPNDPGPAGHPALADLRSDDNPPDDLALAQDDSPMQTQGPASDDEPGPNDDGSDVEDDPTHPHDPPAEDGDDPMSEDEGGSGEHSREDDWSGDDADGFTDNGSYNGIDNGPSDDADGSTANGRDDDGEYE